MTRLAEEVSALTGRAFTAELIGRWWDGELIKLVVEQGLKGVPAPLIAEMLGCSEGVVARWLPKKRPREEGEGGEGCQDGNEPRTRSE